MWYDIRNKRYVLEARLEDDIIQFSVHEFDIPYKGQDRAIMHAHQDALNRRQELRDDMNQYRGPGYW